MPQARHRVFRTALAMALAYGVSSARGADAETLERQVKSAFVLNFIQFVDWPTSAFEKSDDPIVIGVVDQESLGSELTAAVEGKTVRGRKIVVKPITGTTPLKCHVLIAGKLAGKEAEKVLGQVGTAGVLTIGDADDFTEVGGVIRFYLEDRKVRFEINQAASQRALLQISSKLLKLAKVVNH